MERCSSGCCCRHPAEGGGATAGHRLQPTEPISQDHPGEPEDASGCCPNVSDALLHLFRLQLMQLHMF